MSEEYNGRQVQGFYYERPFDQRYFTHLLETLLSVVKFGGQGFSKITRGTVLSRSANIDLLERLQTGMKSIPNDPQRFSHEDSR